MFLIDIISSMEKFTVIMSKEAQKHPHICSVKTVL